MYPAGAGHDELSLEYFYDELHHEPNIGVGESWAAKAGGGALIAYGLSRGTIGGAFLALGGGALLYHGLGRRSQVYEALGVTGEDATPASNPLTRHIHTRDTVTINRPASELYRFWRDPANLPRFMKPIEEVRPIGERQTHWVACNPLGGSPIEWDAEIYDERENERIAWRTIGGAPLDHEGCVEFHPAAIGRGTRVTVETSYRPPGGVLGAAAAKLFSDNPRRQASENLRRFKQLMETGEIATGAGPSCRQVA